MSFSYYKSNMFNVEICKKYRKLYRGLGNMPALVVYV